MWRVIAVCLVFFIIAGALYAVLSGCPVYAPCDLEVIEMASGEPEYGMLVIPEGALYTVVERGETWTRVRYEGKEGYVLNMNMP